MLLSVACVKKVTGGAVGVTVSLSVVLVWKRLRRQACMYIGVLEKGAFFLQSRFFGTLQLPIDFSLTQDAATPNALR